MDQARIRFEGYLKRQFNQSSTAKHYRSDLQLFIKAIGDQSPEEITPLDIDQFVDRQLAAGLRPTTINRRLASLHTFFEYLASEDLSQEWPNPVIWRRHRLKTGMRLPRDVPDHEVTQLFAVIDDPRDQALFSLMVGAGLRVGEVVSLQLDSLEQRTDPTRLAKLRVWGKGSKERTVWLAMSVTDTLQRWLAQRPPVAHDYVFMNRHGHPLSVSGVQYRMQQYCERAGLRLSCHRLRHTFARRLVEHGLPVDSLAKLLGHRQLDTTQRYIDGANPTDRAEFMTAMSKLAMNLHQDRVQHAEPRLSQPTTDVSLRTAPPVDLEWLRLRLSDFPDWLGQALESYLTWRWPTWRTQTAVSIGRNILNVIRRIWRWLADHRQVSGWQTFRRADLEAWRQARHRDGVSNTTVKNELGQLRGLLKYLETHAYPIDPGLFRVKAPQGPQALPRYLPEPEYRRLLATVLQATDNDTYSARFDRAWFFTLAYTGMRISELLDWRLGDLNLPASIATIRSSKSDRDRIAYLTPPLCKALYTYLDARPTLPNQDRVFLLHKRSPSDVTIRMRLTQFGQQASVHVTPHKLRHTFATRLLNQQFPISSIQKLLGHRRLNDTQVYAQIYDQTLYRQFQEAISSLEAIPIDHWPMSDGLHVRRTTQTTVRLHKP